jgi:LysR family transcriptional regulator, hydrogen peroxide-inducible genes activator
MLLAPHAFSLRQLQYAIAVADFLSFRKAALACHVSQPSLSAQLAQLERVLDVKIFERDRRKVMITAGGHQILERARATLKEADDLARSARLVSDPLIGTMRLGVIPTISPYLLPALSKGMRARLPDLTVLWTEDKTATLVKSLEMGGLDAALLALEADVGDVESEIIARDPFFLATSKTNPIGRRKGRASQNELQDVDVLLLDEGHCFRQQALEVCSRGRAHELEFRATSLTTLSQMVANGAGVTLLPALALSTEATRAALLVRPFAEPAPFRTLALIWRKRSPLGPSLKKVAVAIRASYPPSPSKAARR